LPIAQLGSDPARRSLVTARVLLALDIGATVTGEGIETHGELETLATWASTTRRATCSPTPVPTGRVAELGSPRLARHGAETHPLGPLAGRRVR
jgi:hypothetical protein